MKKYFNSTMATILAASLLAGCGGGSTSATTTPASSAGSASSAASASEAAPATTPTGDQILKFGLSGFEGVFNPILSDNVYDAYVTSLILTDWLTLTLKVSMFLNWLLGNYPKTI